MSTAWAVYLAALFLSLASLLVCARTRDPHHRIDASWRVLGVVVAALTGLLVLFSPLDELSDRSFSAHMIEHELLLFTLPIALLAALPLPSALISPWRVLPSVWRRSLGWAWNRWRHWPNCLAYFARPILALALSTFALWIWHMPVLFDLALQNEWIHTLEHISFLATAILFWGLLLGRHRVVALDSNSKRAAYLMAGSMQGGLLGALIALHSQVIYVSYLEEPGVTIELVLRDQRLGGAIMWFAGLTFFGVIAALVFD